MPPHNKATSLTSKKTFIAKNRVDNYRASLRLEGIEPPHTNQESPSTVASVIAHYQALANQAH
jgi:hypothetical protein